MRHNALDLALVIQNLKLKIKNYKYSKYSKYSKYFKYFKYLFSLSLTT